MSLLVIRDDGARWLFDLLIDTDVGASAIVTSHPLDDASQAVDHVQRQPDAFTTRVMVVENPKPGTAGPTGPERTTAALDFLDGCYGQFCTLSGDQRLGVLEGCLLEDSPTSLGLRGRADFPLRWIQPKVVAARSTILPSRVAPRAVSAVDKVDAYKQTVAAMTEAQRVRAIAQVGQPGNDQQVPRSLGAQLADALGAN